MTNVRDVSQFKSFQLSIKDAVYNPKLSLMNLTLEETEIGGIRIALNHVFIDPHGAVPPHLHEHNGEILQAFSDIVMYLGNPVKTKDGKYQMQDDKIVVKWNDPIYMHSGDSVRIAEGTPHCFFNLTDEPAHLQFVLPTSHFQTDAKGNIEDLKLATPPETNF